MAKKKSAQKKEVDRISKQKDRAAYISQSVIPRRTLEDCIKLAKCLFESFNGEATPHQLAIAFGVSPTSSSWKYITGACIAYGLTDGGYNANNISLTKLAQRILAPTEEGDNIKATVEAALSPEIVKRFYEKYNKGKFPTEAIGKNVLLSMQVPQSRLEDIFGIIKNAGEIAGIIHQTKTGPYVAIDTPSPQSTGMQGNTSQAGEKDVLNLSEEIECPEEQITNRGIVQEKNNRVFISHGKNKKIVNQLKELLTFGKFEPIVSVDRETTSIPVLIKSLKICDLVLLL